MEPIKLYVVTFNCGRELIRPDVFASHLSPVLSSSNPPDLLVLCLQEIAPIAYAFLGGSYLLPYFKQIRHAVSFASAKGETESTGYINFHTDNVGMTAIMAFAGTESAEDHIRWVETAGVGLGLYEMGNKGAVGLRVGWAVGEDLTEITVVSAHLAPMEDALERRNEDWKNTVKRLAFTTGKCQSSSLHHHLKSSEDDENEDTARDPLLEVTEEVKKEETSMFTPTSHLIFAGDLNYRTSLQKPSPVDYKDFPQPTEPPDSPRHFSALLEKDQLSLQMKSQKTCHGLQEARIDFPPTYKYSIRARLAAGSRQVSKTEWLWAKHRWPSWCDRILFLGMPSWMKSKYPGSRIATRNYTALPLMETSDHRPVAMEMDIPSVSLYVPESDHQRLDDVRCNPPFSLDPAWKSRKIAGRRREIAVGVGAFLCLTWEGRGILIAVFLGILGTWWIITIGT